jgi:quinol monooxygenase YgiN
MSFSVRDGFNIQVSFWISPDRLDEFFKLITPIMERTMADPKCLFVEAYQSTEDAGHIRLVENWSV